MRTTSARGSLTKAAYRSCLWFTSMNSARVVWSCATTKSPSRTTLVDHPPMVPAFAYRFDAPDRSIVISGDTARSDSLVELAQGADVLVHSAVYLPAVDRLVARVPNATALKRSIIAGQTSAEDVGRVAQAAGVKTLVLSHLIPADDPEVTEQMWTEAARIHFRGPVIVGKDLLEV